MHVSRRRTRAALASIPPIRNMPTQKPQGTRFPSRDSGYNGIARLVAARVPRARPLGAECLLAARLHRFVVSTVRITWVQHVRCGRRGAH
eukprot:8611297-Pyramimonas_sp.AAC.1